MIIQTRQLHDYNHDLLLVCNQDKQQEVSKKCHFKRQTKNWPLSKSGTSIVALLRQGKRMDKAKY